MEHLKRTAARSVYTLEESSVWICADSLDIWIIKGGFGISVSVWGPERDADPLDSIFITYNQLKELEGKK